MKKRTAQLTAAGLAMTASVTGAIVLGIGASDRSTSTESAAAGIVPGSSAPVGLKSAGKSFPAKTDINGRKHKGDPANAPDAKVNAYKKGQPVPIKCQSSTGTEIWDYTTDGWWIPDHLVKTGTDGYAPGIDRCNDSDDEVHGRTNGPAGPSTGTREEKIERVIDAAKSQIGKGYLYSWGAGGKGGPSYGVHHHPDGDPSQGDDYDRYGYDCSGLTLYAFWKGAGIDIGPATGAQYGAGKKVSTNDLRRGDLIFWGDGDKPESTQHVAIYVGDGKLSGLDHLIGAASAVTFPARPAGRRQTP